MMFGRYAVDEPCTACGRHACEGCVTGLVLNAEGDGLDYVEADSLERWYADLATTRYRAATLDRRLRETFHMVEQAI